MSTQNEQNQLKKAAGQAIRPASSNGLPGLRQLLGGNGQNQSKPLTKPSQRQEEPLRVETVEHNGLRWVNIWKPDDAEIAWLHQNFEFNALHLEDITSRLQRPKIDDYEDYLFIVLHFPVYNKAERRTHSSELDVFVGPNYVVTVTDGRLRSLNRLFEQCKNNSGKRYGVLGRTTSFALYRVIDVLVDYCFPIVSKLSEKMEDIEDRIFETSSRNTLYDISVLRSDIIALRRIIRPQISVIANLERRRAAEDEEMEAYFSDITDHISKIWDSLEEFKDIIEGLSATYDSLTSHRLNQVIKALTVISVIILPLTLISGIYGMNVPLPFQDAQWAFYGIMALLALITIGMLLFFRLRKWL